MWSSRAACFTEVEQMSYEDNQDPVLCMGADMETLLVQVVLSGSSTLPSGGHCESAPAPDMRDAEDSALSLGTLVATPHC